MTVKTIPHFLNGEETNGVGERTQPVFNPATGEQTGELRLADAADLETAVANARKAAETWGDISLAKRTAV
ncbi:aldehyde dehydrogenase family protein, partial [Sinomonas humi]